MPTLPTFCATGKLECVILISILQFFSSNFVDASSLGLVKEVIGIYMSNGTACAVNYFDSEVWRKTDDKKVCIKYALLYGMCL